MNHGKKKWVGEVLLNKGVFGIGKRIKISEATDSGYKDLNSGQFTNSKDMLRIKTSLEGNGEREAKFGLIKIGYPF